jgi:hypothetical protein
MHLGASDTGLVVLWRTSRQLSSSFIHSAVSDLGADRLACIPQQLWMRHAAHQTDAFVRRVLLYLRDRKRFLIGRQPYPFGWHQGEMQVIGSAGVLQGHY